MRNHQQQIDQARVIDEVMRNKYTGEALYEWMIGQIAAVHFQSYQLALDMAKKAERSLQFELGREDFFSIEGSYWDSLKKGRLPASVSTSTCGAWTRPMSKKASASTS